MVGGSVQSRHNTGRQAPPLSQGVGVKGEGGGGGLEREGGGKLALVLWRVGLYYYCIKGLKKMVGVFTGAHHFTAWFCQVHVVCGYFIAIFTVMYIYCCGEW